MDEPSPVVGDEYPQGVFGAIVVGWVLGWPSGAARAAVAMKGWEWFVAGTFGAPELGLVEAWGLFFLVSFATLHIDRTSTKGRPMVVVMTGAVTSLLISAMTFMSLLVLVSLR